ncbi:TonB-dependent receptor [Gaetbulibacter jejuensis]|uniref:TonB-dependent receptor n=1 Tax=Gaetbulibacter jejuensis TaxID=584607 RepID=A0ABN1JIC2_9FLAO
MQKINLKNIYGSRYYYTFLLFCLVGQLAFAQTQVKGVVTDENGMALPGVNILEKGTSNGVYTDFDGNYVITVKDNATLVFSYLGFVTQETAVSGRVSINVTLVESLESLDEVVVIGYGSQLKEDLSGSVSTIDTEALNNLPQVSVDQLMQGRASGVSITQNSGQPGSAVSVRIRGVNTISGSAEPLYIIDGVPISGDSNNISTSGRSIADNDLGQGDGATGVSPLAALNPSDIESINILKDASATAIYGSRGANGVVIITTKSGKNKKGTLRYNTYLAIQRPTNFYEVMDLSQYARLQNEMAEIYGLNPQIEFLNPSLLGPGTNWQQEIFDDAVMQSHEVSFSGGSEDVNYFLSAGYLDQDGTVIGSGFDRINVRANVGANITDKIKVGANLTASRTNDKLTLNNATNGIIYLSLLNNPATAVYNPDGSFAGPDLDDDFKFENPIARALSLSNRLERNRFFGNIFAELKLGKNLTYRTEFGGDFGNNVSDRFQPTFSYGEITGGESALSVRRENNDFWILKNILTFQKKFNNKHDVTVMLGQEAQESKWQGVIASDGEFVSNDVPILGTGNAIDNTDQYKGSTALSSYFGRAIYSFDNKYNITASIRADGSSKFAEGNKWGYFPSVSASWRLSNENFMDDFDAIQNIKIYGGYGEVGNQAIPNFAYGARLNTVSTGLGTGFEFANFANEDLKWESSTQTNLGLDFSVFDSRLNATVEVYNKVSKDFLYQLAVTDFITGGNSPGAIAAPWVNLGEMVNKGIDVTLNYKTKGSQDFSWNSSLTFSHYKNEVKELLGDLTIFGEMTMNTSNQNVTITQVGQPIGLFYGYKVEGIFRTLDDINGAPVQFGRPFEDALFSTTWLGDIKFKDINGDGVVNTDDRTVIGNPHPDFTFGFQNSFNYKNFDLSIFMQGSYGNDVFNAVNRSLTAGNQTYTNQLPSVLDYWSVDNPNASNPRLARNDTPNINISDRYIEDGSYLRIQNVTLGYTLPSDATRTFGINRLRVYGMIQNLYTFTKYSGYDPEIGVYNQNALLMGVDNGRYPTPRIFTLGLNVEF